MAREESSGISSKRFVVVFVGAMLVLLLAFILMVRWAVSVLPQEDEVISVSQAAQMIEEGGVERILIQGHQDVFLYLPDQPRPLYTQLELGESFTQTMDALGIASFRFPPLVVEEE